MTLPRSDHFNGKTFFQGHHAGALRHRDFWRWQLTARRKAWPRTVTVPLQPPPPRPGADEVVITWIGHASFLLQTPTSNLLIDPVFSERVSPVSWAGPRRVHPPGVALDALPPIHTVLLSHDHYDHCDLASLRPLASRHDPEFVAPLRHRDLLTAAGAKRITELDWWQTHAVAGGASLTLTPSQHWSNRLGTPRNYRLWGGFFLKLGSKRVWFVGDSGYDAEIFRSVRQHGGAPDAALVPIGAYEPRWFMRPMHMNPADAVQLHRDVGARLSIAMHWGTFRLTDEGRDDPVEALATARTEAGVAAADFRVIAPGASVVV
ncbi:MBL fold metallo-hydrolase [Horticoccus sp. 23ND18S-11]|uniref:MBL fold metallo-hydrolase n=1 Tax=Horticoccus sp. 23ND18S-11 TaxID=3391832 RepID=UPI0039C9DDA3